MVTSTSTNKVSRAKNEVLIGKGSNAAALSKNALKKRMRKSLETVAQAKDDAVLEIDVNNVIHEKRSSKPLTESKRGKKSRKTQDSKKFNANGLYVVQPNLETDEGSDGDDELATKEVGRANRVKSFEQRELVARAFAGDDVVKVGSSSFPRRGHSCFD